MCLTLLLQQHLLPQHLLDHPQVVRLAINNILQLLDVTRKLLDLSIVEGDSIVCGLLDVEARADIDKNMVRAG